MTRHILFFFLLSIGLCACANNSKDSENRTQIRLKTNKGTITIALYNETPLHRDNFIKLTKEKFFDGTLFHRVIDNFMIQGGDPNSKNSKQGAALGNGGPGYEIPAEFVEGLFHKKGVLAAARNGDNINPKRKSAGSQFYLVEGKVFKMEQLLNMEKSKNANLRSSLIQKFKKENKAKLDSVAKLKKVGEISPLDSLVAKLNEKIDAVVAKEGFHFSEQQKEAYTTIGGVPHLDGAYTVFGEIIEGQEVVDAIAEVATDKRNRPLEDVIILKAEIIK